MAQSENNKILKLIKKITDQPRDAYIYRGETRNNGKISSTLYREYKGKIDKEYFNVEAIQKEYLKQVKTYTAFTNETDILTELQHYGGKTNLIDFTTDYLIALFFACDGLHKEDGRIILLNKQTESDKITKPKKNQNNRVISQKSIFFTPLNGFISEEEVKIIPIYKELKKPILAYLRKHHDISTTTIYNDIFGYIQNQTRHKDTILAFFTALSYQEGGDHTKTIEYYTQAITLNPEFTEAFNNRGNAYYNKGEYDRAIEDCDQAIKLNPEFAEAFNNRGAAYNTKGEYDRAIADCNQAIELDSELAEAFNNHGIAYSGKGEYDRAIEYYDQAIELDPEFAMAFNNRGVAYRKKGEYGRAIEDYDQAIELDPEFAMAYYNRGVAYSNKGEYDRAIEDCDQAIKLDPKFAIAFSNRGGSYGNKGEYDRAIKDCDQAIKLNPKFAEAFYNRGIAYRKKGDEDRALKDFKKANKLDPTY